MTFCRIFRFGAGKEAVVMMDEEHFKRGRGNPRGGTGAADGFRPE